MKDIIDALVTIGYQFKECGFEPPAAVILSSHDEGMRLLGALRQREYLDYQPGSIGRSVEHPDGSIWMELEFYGIKIRWPANKWALEGGGYVWG